MRLLIVAFALLIVLAGVGLVVVSTLDERLYPFSGPIPQNADDRMEARLARVQREMAHKRFVDVDLAHDCGDCARQEAGFAFARRRRIDDPDRCPSADEDFREGCRAWGERLEAEEARAER